MMSFDEAFALAEQEKRAGNVESFYVENGAIYAESPEGGFYVWFSPEPVRDRFIDL